MINQDDLKIEIYDPNPGGMKPGLVPIDLKVTHIPSGIVVIIPGYRNQYHAKMAAIDALLGVLTGEHAPERWQR